MDNKRGQQSLSRTYKIKGDGGQIVAFKGRGRRGCEGEKEGGMEGERKGEKEGEREREREGEGGGRRSVKQPTLGGSTSLHLS